MISYDIPNASKDILMVNQFGEDKTWVSALLFHYYYFFSFFYFSRSFHPRSLSSNCNSAEHDPIKTTHAGLPCWQYVMGKPSSKIQTPITNSINTRTHRTKVIGRTQSPPYACRLEFTPQELSHHLMIVGWSLLHKNSVTTL